MEEEKKEIKSRKRVRMQKKDILSVFGILMAVILGLGVVLYPTISTLVNQHTQTVAVAGYQKQVEAIDTTDYEGIRNAAIQFNAELAAAKDQQGFAKVHMKEYMSLLSIKGSSVMGYVEIPKIKVSLPLYHTADDDILQVAVGHIEWSSLPVGGENTHTVLSGHRGLPSAMLFTNLDQIVEGDQFRVHVLQEVLTYEVDQILTVLPTEIDELMIEEGKDLCTLVTCTPYGVNSHRLLVRGHRVETTWTEEAKPSPIDTVTKAVTTGGMDSNLWMIPVFTGGMFLIWLILFKLLGFLRSKIFKKHS